MGARASVSFRTGEGGPAWGDLQVARWRWPDAAEAPLGAGDVLIAGTVGAMFGPAQTLVVLFVGVLMAGVSAALLLVTRRASRQDAIPYGAFLCGAALVGLAM